MVPQPCRRNTVPGRKQTHAQLSVCPLHQRGPPPGLGAEQQVKRCAVRRKMPSMGSVCGQARARPPG